ncbi:hypothetical protein IMCC3317_31550 [Kordia antarctica]|uniref:Uncharacterized protein n=1 Tax=Kordia antarctica TaxID=1218801 RepID=A0A7L4ZM49_9FLAO|nr:hypothetical protein [Kordia antarctica]QHI37773.1 hypothetical protein IMCC3317_31550 [Kordia antarctica]
METPKTTHKIISFGKFLIVLGAIFGIHPFAVIISIPLYVIGLIIIWKSTIVSRKRKIIWTIAPVFGIFIVWILIILITLIFD